MYNKSTHTKMISELLRPNILQLTPYSSARDEFSGSANVLLDANESHSPLPSLPNGINRYPNPRNEELRRAIANLKNVDAANIFVGNGSDEAVDLLYRCFCNPQKDSALVFPPTYGMYGVCASINDVALIESPLNEQFEISQSDALEKLAQNPKLTFICNPNNPTGNVQAPEVIEDIIAKSKGIVVVDEAYIDFCPQYSVLPLIYRYKNLVVLQTLSKAWGMAGARIGLAFASKEIVNVLSNVKFPYNVGKPSTDLALQAISQTDAFAEFVKSTVAQRQNLASELDLLPIVERVYPSLANFLLVKFTNNHIVYKYLLSKGIVVRDRSSQPLCNGCIRITVGSSTENELLLTALRVLNTQLYSNEKTTNY